MRFLIDECTGKRLAKLLEKEGYDVIFAGDIMSSASDEEIIKKCEDDDRILVTDDKDFGEMVFRLGKPIRGVILIRIVAKPETRLEAILKLLKNYDVKNKFIVLQENAVRIRNI
ncbi:MAG: DUF5615 family PIN-like protein [Candidatus Aenigmatarchaeota archaeon]